MRRLTFVFAMVLLWASSAAAQVVITPTPMGSTVGKPFPQLYITASGYVSFGTTGGSSGYGFRDNGGTMQMKNSGGSWFDVPASTASAGGWTDTGTVVQLTTGTDTLYVQSAGPHGVGTVGYNYARTTLGGNFNSGGASSVGIGIYSTGSITGSAGDTSWLVGQQWNNEIVTPGSGETFSIAAQSFFVEPGITVGAGDTVTESATVYIRSAATEAVRNYSFFNDSAALSRFDGSIVVGNTTLSSKMTTGMSLRQAGADDEILSMHSTDVAHGMTDVSDTDTYGTVQKRDATAGGLKLSGFGEITRGMQLVGYVTTEDTGKSSGNVAAITIDGFVKSGTSAVSMGANANILSVRNGTSGSLWIVDSDGDTWQSGIVSTAASFASGAGSPATEGAFRVSCTGVSPARVCSVLLYDGGAVRTLASMTY